MIVSDKNSCYAREQCMEAALTDALNWLETGGGDVVSGELFDTFSSILFELLRKCN